MLSTAAMTARAEQVRAALDRVVTGSGAAAVLEAAEDAAHHAELLVHEAVGAVRAGGASWSEVGEVLGITQQGAHQRFGQQVLVLDAGQPWSSQDVEDVAARVTAQVLDAWRGRPDRALTAQSWREYCSTEMYLARLVELPTATRVRVVVALTAAGMSARAVAAALTVGEHTVRADLKRAGAPVRRRVTGVDGRTYRAPGGADPGLA